MKALRESFCINLAIHFITLKHIRLSKIWIYKFIYQLLYIFSRILQNINNQEKHFLKSETKALFQLLSPLEKLKFWKSLQVALVVRYIASKF